MIWKLIVLACLLTISQSRSVDVKFLRLFDRISSRITGGRDAKPGEFPHQASLQVGLPPLVDYTHFCGGTILNENWILTAVHCLDGYEEANKNFTEMFPANLTFVVVAGKHNLAESEDTEQTVLVDKYFKHPRYDLEQNVGSYDIGLIKVKVPLELNKRVAAIALPKPLVEPVDGVILSGWGALNNINPNDPEMPSVLQTVNVPIVNRKDCNEAVKNIIYEEEHRWIKYDVVNETNICTGPLDGGVSGCEGDSGGPLIKRHYNGKKEEVVGVASWTLTPCGRKGAPTVYVKVSAFIDWIDDIMSKN